MVETDMRLMCLDKGVAFRIGWAAAAARLHDEVALIPGCSMPVILRRQQERTYQLVGPAIVIGAMRREIWQKRKAEEVQKIIIV
jgi:hypothetical protein